MRQIFFLALIVVFGAAVLAPMLMMLDLERLPGDYDLVLEGRHYMVPVTYSLCASAGLGLLYYIMKK